MSRPIDTVRESAPDSGSQEYVERFPGGRAVVLATGGDTPYTRAMTARGSVDAYLCAGALAWIGPGLWGAAACGIGPLDQVSRLIGLLRRDGHLGAGWIDLPRATEAAVADHLAVKQLIDWQFQWLVGDPPPSDHLVHQVVALDETDPADPDAISAILDASLPDSHARVGDPGVRMWHGIRHDNRLVACAADESVSGVGILSGIAVVPDVQGRGLGTALTVTLTKRLHEEHGAVALAVMASNQRASKLYARLGFTGVLSRTAVLIE